MFALRSEDSASRLNSAGQTAVYFFVSRTADDTGPSHLSSTAWTRQVYLAPPLSSILGVHLVVLSPASMGWLFSLAPSGPSISKMYDALACFLSGMLRMVSVAFPLGMSV